MNSRLFRLLIVILALALPAAFAQASGGAAPTHVFLPLVVNGRSGNPTPPTPTPTPTATPGPATSPTPTPTATSTPVSAGVVILPNHSSWVSSTNALNVLGEVQNNLGVTAAVVKVTVAFLDGSGKTLGSWFTYLDLSYLAAGQRTCFKVVEFPIPAGYASYAFEPVTYSTGFPGRLPVMSVVTQSGSIDQFGDYSVTGTVRNDDTQTATSLQAVGTLYDGAGEVADCWFGSVAPSTLAVGQVGTFSVLFAGRPSYADVASFRVQFQGTPQ